MSNKHKLICGECGYSRFVEISTKEWGNNGRSVRMNIPYFHCSNCDRQEPFGSIEYYDQIAKTKLESLNRGENVDLKFKFETSKFDDLYSIDLKYCSSDYFLIPGLLRDEADGYLCPVFFDKDLLLYYNSHPNFEVRLSSFSSGNIFVIDRDEFLLSHGFGINRNGNIFAWLGDLNNDFGDGKNSKDFLRFKASNIDSDHDVFSKFYLSENPRTPEEAFQKSDNENRLFALKFQVEKMLSENYNIEISQSDIFDIFSCYRAPILDEREQIFSAYNTLNKFLVENVRVQDLKAMIVEKGGVSKKIKSYGSLKTIQEFFRTVVGVSDIETIVSPLFVLSDLRQLHGHFSDTSFEEKYQFCKERLKLDNNVSDYEVYVALIANLLDYYGSIKQNIEFDKE